MPGRSSLRTRLVAALIAGAAVAGSALPASADELDNKKAEATRVADRLEELEVTASTLDESYNQVAAELVTLDGEVAQAEADVAQFEAKLTTIREQAGGFALKAYMASDSGLGGLLGGSAAGNEAAQREGYSSVAFGASTTITDELKATTDDAQAAREDLASKRDRKAELETQLADRRTEVDAAIVEQQELKATVQGELAELVAAEQARREAAAAKVVPQRLQSPAAPSGGGSAGGAAAPTTDAGDDTSSSDESSNGDQARPDANDDGGSSDESGSSSGAGSNVPPASPGASGAVEAAMSQLGVPWKFAAASPGVAFDCSGLTMWAWGQAGVGLPHSSKLQYSSLPHVPSDQAQPGDLFFFGDPIHHVGMYIGNGQMVNSTQSGDVVKVGNAYRDDLVGVARPG